MCVCVFFYRRSGRVPNERRCEAVGVVERRRYVGPVTVETEQTGRDGPAGRFQQRADEPAGERMRRECRLRLFHVDETKKCDRVVAATASAVAALFLFLPTTDVAATRYHGKVIRESCRLRGGTCFWRTSSPYGSLKLFSFLDNACYC